MDLLSAALDESGIDLQPVANVQPIQRAATAASATSTASGGIGGGGSGAAAVTTTAVLRTHPTVVKAVTTNNNVVPGQPAKILLARPQTVMRQQVVAPGSQIVLIQRALAPGTHRQPTLIKVRAPRVTQQIVPPRGQTVHVVGAPTKQVSLTRPVSGVSSPQIRLVRNGSPVVYRTTSTATPSTSGGQPRVVRVGVGGQPKVITRVLTSKGPAMIQSPRVVTAPAAVGVTSVAGGVSVSGTTTTTAGTLTTRIIQAPARVVQSANGHTIIQRVVTTTAAQGSHPTLRGVSPSSIRPNAPVTQIIQKVAAPVGAGTTTIVRKITNGLPPKPNTTAVVSRAVPNPRSLLVASRASLAPSSPSPSRVSIMPGPLKNGETPTKSPSLIRPQLVDDLVVEEEEEMGVAETYSNYVPAKLRIGQKHPDPVVETASLSSVPPPDVHYRLSIPEETIDTGALSALQLESITYACQQHDVILPNGQRAGYLIGDGPGIGKGRTVAGIIFENYLLGRKRALWFSVSNDLRFDAERDLKDIGATKLEIHPLNKFKYHKITSKKNGSCKRGVIFATYSSLIGESSSSSSKYRTRLKQLLHWCGEDFDGVIVFDECHKAKNLYPAGSSKPTKTGQTVLELQNRLPKARVVYASATGASEPKNMAYMTRLGIWGEGTQFKEFNDFLNAVEKRGVGSMELVAMDMKLRGMYIARQLSFSGVTFRIEEVSLQDHFVQTYNLSVKLWVEARRMFAEAAQLMDADTRVKKTMWGQFWGAHQRFFKYLCIAAKVPYVVKVAKEAIKDGKCVVIGLQSTGESRTLEQLEEQGGELTDFVSTAKGVFQSLVEKHFPAPNRKKTLALLGLGGSFLDERDFMPKKEEIPIKAESEPEDSSDADSSSDVSSEDASDDSDEDDLSGDDFNPFGGDNGDEDDPWANRNLKRKRKNKDNDKEKKPKREKKEKKVKSEKKEPKKPVPKQERSPSPFSEMTQQTLYFSKDSGDKAAAMKLQLLNMLENIGEYLPINTLDQLIDELGGPTFVAEMTGRKGRLVNGSSGVLYESRTESDVPLEILNVTEKQRFMDGEKNIAIISEAASSGISLQADRRAENRKRRLHITLELPWSADRAVQQFGRTHRSNQVSAPEYLFLISDLAGERRFASIVAKRIESMGALTHGDRRAGESRDLSVFNIDNNYGRMALEQTMKAIMGHERPMVKSPSDYDGNFFQDCKEGLLGVGLVVKDDHSQAMSLDKDYNNISKFLNRLLGLKVTLQNALFKYFMDTMDAVVSTAKKTGRFDMGILDLGANADNVKRDSTEEFVRESPTGSTITELHTVRIERGMSWEEAIDKYKELCENDEGFYSSNQMTKNGKKTAILAVYAGKTKKGKQKEKIFRIFRPHTGLQMKQETLADLRSKYTFLTPDDAQDLWQAQYESSEKSCSHIFGSGFCNKRNSGHPCDVGLRSRVYHVLAGSVFTVWSKIETALSTNNMNSSKLQVVRLKTENDLRIVGTIVPPICVPTLRTILAQDAQKTSIKKFNDEDELQAD